MSAEQSGGVSVKSVRIYSLGLGGLGCSFMCFIQNVREEICLDVYASLPPVYQGHVDVWSPVLFGPNVPLAPYLPDALGKDVANGYLIMEVKIDGRVRLVIGLSLSLEMIISSRKSRAIRLSPFHVDREYFCDEDPLEELEFTISFERHEEATRFNFEHSGYVSLALNDFPLEHWNKHRVHIALGAIANPTRVSQVSLTGADYTGIFVSARFESYHNIPGELRVKNSDGLGSYAQVWEAPVNQLTDTTQRAVKKLKWVRAKSKKFAKDLKRPKEIVVVCQQVIHLLDIME
ncbi:hypothetical protein PR202_gb16359 [Eleusine coracana subsp. coracana]|uniref:Uncharacterized protein n=1 Tax=Eleusine coracana subsp. coracana TaxID=191504 RepID=A0AAV5EXX5_ELECO|nr:hypothetical protein PR202_gb16359 [Eleusine coracana subsp. coracana]